jgi:3-hydroxyacyl-CoA dehydrogenase
MGSGVAEAALVAGLDVLMKDVTHEALGRGRARIVHNLERQIQKGKMTSDPKEILLQHLSTTTSFGDFKGCDFIVEAA